MRVINMFAGPGYAKSSVAAGLFYLMKAQHMRVELVTERAREAVLDGGTKVLRCQPLLFGEQVYRLERLVDGSDWVITDSPVLLSAVYNKHKYPESFTRCVIDVFRSFDNINIALNRTRNPEELEDDPGRRHTLPESQMLDFEIKQMLSDLSLPFESFDVNEGTADDIYQKIIQPLNT